MSNIQFFEKEHKYLNVDTNEEYISCTTLLGLFKHKFDVDKMANLCAKKYGKTPDQIKQEWEINTKKSTDYGTLIHSCIEGYIKNDKTLIENNPYKDCCYNGYKTVTNLIGNIGLKSEVLLYNDTYKIAGQSDIVQITNGFKKKRYDNTVTPTINILDIKTNKKIEFFSEYDEYLKYPLEHLHNCNYNIYSLQLSLYAYILSTMNPDMKIGLLSLIHYNKDDNIWISIHCPYMLYEVKALLKIYKETKLLNK